jgi:hypothetical protein
MFYLHSSPSSSCTSAALTTSNLPASCMKAASNNWKAPCTSEERASNWESAMKIGITKLVAQEASQWEVGTLAVAVPPMGTRFSTDISGLKCVKGL